MTERGGILPLAARDGIKGGVSSARLQRAGIGESNAAYLLVSPLKGEARAAQPFVSARPLAGRVGRQKFNILEWNYLIK